MTASTPMTQVILVDESDRQLGLGEKLASHRAPAPLHRAFSAFLLAPDGRLVLQRRALTKYHFAGRWANSCCGHPLPAESVTDAADRRALDELGVGAAELRVVGSVIYQAFDAESGLMENEFDHVVVGRLAADPKPVPAEVAELRLLDPAGFATWLAASPDDFAPWVSLVWPLAQAQLST